MRRLLLALIACSVLVGCGGSDRPPAGEASRDTLEALAKRPGDDVALITGTSDYAPGRVRYSFLVVRDDARAVFRPRARVWIARSLKERPFARTVARLEAVGVPGASQSAEDDVSQIYVARFRVPRAGKYWVLVEPIGGAPIQGLGNVVVASKTDSPPVGAKAFPSRTPTLATAGGDLDELTTRVPPDTELLRHSIADSLAARKPFVVVFATPKYCESRTCGPVVDVVDAVRRRYAATGVRFIHVEIYRDNDPSKGTNRWVREWNLPTEPWVFVVDAEGTIRAKFEGAVSEAELEDAIRRHLL